MRLSGIATSVEPSGAVEPEIVPFLCHHFEG